MVRVLFTYKGPEHLGIEYLSACLKKAGHKVDLLIDPSMDVYLNSNVQGTNQQRIMERFLLKVKRYKPDLLAFSAVTNSILWNTDIMTEYRKHTDVPIIIGGVHPTILPEQTLKRTPANIVCVGEGEDAFVELADRMEAGKEYKDIPNIWVKEKDGSIVRNEKRPLKEDLDSLPFPDRDIFAQYGMLGDRAYILTGRGCPYQCTYCFNHVYRELYKGKGKWVRRRSAENVLEELRQYKAKYGLRSVHFLDDDFTLEGGWLKDFCQKYKAEFNLPFHALIRANHVKPDVIVALKSANCVDLGFGLEAGAPEIRNGVMKRNMNDETILHAAKLIKMAGINLSTFNMFGMPGETAEQMMKTVNMNYKIETDSIFAYIFYPFPGTQLLDICYDKGMITDEVYEDILNGKGGYHIKSVINQPYEDFAREAKFILPILNWAPNFIKRHTQKIIQIGARMKSRLKYEAYQGISNLLLFNWDFPYRFKIINQTRRLFWKVTAP